MNHAGARRSHEHQGVSAGTWSSHSGFGERDVTTFAADHHRGPTRPPRQNLRAWKQSRSRPAPRGSACSATGAADCALSSRSAWKGTPFMLSSRRRKRPARAEDRPSKLLAASAPTSKRPTTRRIDHRCCRIRALRQLVSELFCPIHLARIRITLFSATSRTSAEVILPRRRRWTVPTDRPSASRPVNRYNVLRPESNRWRSPPT